MICKDINRQRMFNNEEFFNNLLFFDKKLIKIVIFKFFVMVFFILLSSLQKLFLMFKKIFPESLKIALKLEEEIYFKMKF